MASIEELQEELIRQSSRRLEAEHDRVRIEELWRASTREITALKAENAALESEKAALALRVEEMENEIADLSTSLLEQANQKVAEANRRAKAAEKSVDELKDLNAFQEAELQALKEMLERNEKERSHDFKAFASVHPASSGNLRRLPSEKELGGERKAAGSATASPIPSFIYSFDSGSHEGPRVKAPPLPGELSRDLLLDLDAYASPLRPLMRTDLREFEDFKAVWGVERDVHPSVFAKLESPPWRRTKFVQRVIQEDIEPTLRLDRSPHLSWLSLRAFHNGVLEQTLSLEPVSAKERPWAQRPSQPCLLCGETRGAEMYARTFWAIPAPDAEPIVLDLTCVVKTRLVCELVAFLRTVARRPPADDSAKVQAWRQCNSMREQLFWARTGGLYPEAAETLAAAQMSAIEDFDFQIDESENQADQVLDHEAEHDKNTNSSGQTMGYPPDSAESGNAEDRSESSSSLSRGSAVPSVSQSPRFTPSNSETTVFVDAKSTPSPARGATSGSEPQADQPRAINTQDHSEVEVPIEKLRVVGENKAPEIEEKNDKIQENLVSEAQTISSPTMPGGWPV